MGEDAFKYILSGIELQKFMADHWEKKPMYIERINEGAHHYDKLNVSRKTIDEMLRNNLIEYTKNLDVTMYENGVRQTFNPGEWEANKKKNNFWMVVYEFDSSCSFPLDGRAYAASVWQYYTQGCSIRKCR